MRGLNAVVAVGLSLGILFGVVPGAWGGGAGAGKTCLIDHPGSAAIALKVTAAVEVLDAATALVGGQSDMDVVLRLERGGTIYFDYVHIKDLVGDNLDIACAFLPHEDSGNPDVIAMGARINTAFGFSGRVFCVTQDSISKDDPGLIHIFPAIDGVALARALSLANLTVYAVSGRCS